MIVATLAALGASVITDIQKTKRDECLSGLSISKRYERRRNYVEFTAKGIATGHDIRIRHSVYRHGRLMYRDVAAGGTDPNTEVTSTAGYEMPLDMARTKLKLHVLVTGKGCSRETVTMPAVSR